MFEEVSGRRASFVYEVYKKDKLTDEFLEKYDSLFIKYGFDGEQALLGEDVEWRKEWMDEWMMFCISVNISFAVLNFFKSSIVPNQPYCVLG